MAAPPRAIGAVVRTAVAGCAAGRSGRRAVYLRGATGRAAVAAMVGAYRAADRHGGGDTGVAVARPAAPRPAGRHRRRPAAGTRFRPGASPARRAERSAVAPRSGQPGAVARAGRARPG